MKKQFLFSAGLLLAAGITNSQPDSTLSPTLSISGFLDVYYGFDFNRPDDGNRPGFLYNHSRHNEMNLNLGLVQFRADGGHYRAHLGLMAGTYAQANLAAEPALLKNVYEANAGVTLNKKRTIWLDAGILGSHIGFESAISSDNPTLTRSLQAENSPYYLSGVKLSWSRGENWHLAFLVVNGWQRIRRVSGNQPPAVGTQVRYAKGNLVLNWSTFAGTDDPDSTRRIRVFHNFYGQFQLTGKWRLTTGFDIGIQQKRKGAGEVDAWFSPVIISRFALNDRWALALRGEYYQDEKGVIISADPGADPKITGLSANLDHFLNQNVMIRVESRWLRHSEPVFVRKNVTTRHNLFLCGSIAVKIP